MSKKEALDLLTALCHVDQTLSQTDSGHKSSGTWEVNASSGSEALILFVNIVKVPAPNQCIWAEKIPVTVMLKNFFLL